MDPPQSPFYSNLASCHKEIPTPFCSNLVTKPERNQQRQRPKKPAPRVSGTVNMSTRINDDNSIAREVPRDPATDGSTGTSLIRNTPSQQDLARRRCQYFDGVFSYREPYHSPRHRVNQDSIVVIEIKTNVPVRTTLI